jgi:hypothetical protein
VLPDPWLPKPSRRLDPELEELVEFVEANAPARLGGTPAPG